MSPTDIVLVVAAVVSTFMAVGTVIWHAGVVRQEARETRATMTKEIGRLDDVIENLSHEFKNLDRSFSWLLGHLNVKPPNHE